LKFAVVNFEIFHLNAPTKATQSKVNNNNDHWSFLVNCEATLNTSETTEHILSFQH
jgi:hypothetical protein